jgi:hypothetical protein
MALIRQYLPIFILGIAGMFLQTFLIKSCSPEPKPLPPIISHGIEVIRDTVREIIHYPAVAYTVPGKIQYDTTRDTVIVSKPFTASNDTAVGKIELHTDFLFPEMIFRQKLIRAADSIIHTHSIVFIHDTIAIREDRSILTDILTHIGATGIGFAGGYAIKR